MWGNILALFLNRQKCKAKIRTYADSTRILSRPLDHNHPASDRSLERKLVRNRLKWKATEDISSRPAKVIKNELFASNEEIIKPSYITNLRQALYRERRKKFPKLPSSIEEVSDVLNFLKPINTSKNERRSLPLSFIVIKCTGEFLPHQRKFVNGIHCRWKKGEGPGKTTCDEFN